jgi:phasin family protein
MMSDSAQEKMAQALQEQQAQWSTLATKALDSSIKLVELNLKMTRQSLEESTQTVRELLKVKSPEQLLTIDQGLLQDRLSQAMQYASQIGAIASEFAADVSQVTQNQMAGNLGKINQLSAAVEAPLAMKNLFPDTGVAQQGYEQWVEAGKKFVESFGQNFPASFNGAGFTGVAKPAAAKPVPAKPAPGAKARARTR